MPAVATVSAGLIGGLFFAYSFSVNPGLNKLSDVGYLSAMQSINRAILNPVFLCTFLGTGILLPVSTGLQYGTPVRFWLLLAASVLYIIGTLGVTMGGNVPLNEALDAFSIETASPDALSVQRRQFEGPWNRLHAIRTAASVLAFALAAVACIFPRNEG